MQLALKQGTNLHRNRHDSSITRVWRRILAFMLCGVPILASLWNANALRQFRHAIFGCVAIDVSDRGK